MRKRNWVGTKVTPEGIVQERFLYAGTPTEQTHGQQYPSGTMGPFSTKLGTLAYVHYGQFSTKLGTLAYVHYGQGNPHTTTVGDCERVAKQHKDDLRGKPNKHVWTAATLYRVQ